LPEKALYNTTITIMVTFTDRLSDDNDYKREELIKKIEHALGQMTLKELEALSYDMFTKGYLED
jgi:hypothetical protein